MVVGIWRKLVLDSCPLMGALLENCGEEVREKGKGWEAKGVVKFFKSLWDIGNIDEGKETQDLHSEANIPNSSWNNEYK